MALEREKETYRRNVAEWQEHLGRFVLIHGDDVVGFFDTYADAIDQGYAKFRLEPFLVKRIQVQERVELVTRLLGGVPS